MQHSELIQYTTELENPNRLQSVTQERDLDAFLSAATLADTDFTAGA
jgi:large subunit GTPase 1